MCRLRNLVIIAAIIVVMCIPVSSNPLLYVTMILKDHQSQGFNVPRLSDFTLSA